MACFRPSSSRLASSLLLKQASPQASSSLLPIRRQPSSDTLRSFCTSSPSGSTASTSSTPNRSGAGPADSLIAHLDPSTLPPILRSSQGKNKTLYDHLSNLPNDGVGTKVRQVKWAARGLDVPYGEGFKGPVTNPADRKDRNHLCYWEITRVKLRLIGENGKPHGKAWGRLVWRGVPVTPEGKDERIRGGLKFAWDSAR